MSAPSADLALARATRESAARETAGQGGSAADLDSDVSDRRGFPPVRVVHSSWMSFALKERRRLGR